HAQWDLRHRGLDSVIRVSPHVYTSEGDVAALVSAISEISRGTVTA
ncbi:MAG: hypothetical protein JWQ43_2055, partial [Glaciihabitans sp.]|nr:hypothetical protein [Glaciihabitans sp.]